MTGCHRTWTAKYGDSTVKRWLPLFWEGAGTSLTLPEISITESGTHVFHVVDLPATLYPETLIVEFDDDKPRPDANEFSQLAGTLIEVVVRDGDGESRLKRQINLASADRWFASRRTAPANLGRQWHHEVLFGVELAHPLHRRVESAEPHSYEVVMTVHVSDPKPPTGTVAYLRGGGRYIDLGD